MSFDITVDGGTSVRLPTAGKYCDRDIVVTAEGGSGSALVLTMGNPTKDVTLSQIDKLDIVCENATSIGEYAFQNCTSLTSIDLPVANSIGYCAFQNCTSLTSIDLPVANSLDDYAFADCTSLTSIDLPVATTIDGAAFAYCTSLTSVDLPVTTTIGENAFQKCTSLTSVDLPVTTTIGEGAFQNCTSLTSVDLPVTTTIGEGAFYGCSVLSSLILRSNTLCNIDIVAIVGTNILSAEGMPTGQGFIYVPSAFYESYIADLVPKAIELATSVGMSMDEATATYIVTMILRKIEDYPEITGG